MISLIDPARDVVARPKLVIKSCTRILKYFVDDLRSASFNRCCWLAAVSVPDKRGRRGRGALLYLSADNDRLVKLLGETAYLSARAAVGMYQDQIGKEEGIISQEPGQNFLVWKQEDQRDGRGT